MAKLQAVDLNTSVADFARRYQTPGSGITAVLRHGNAIRVDVDAIAVAARLPISYNGFTVATFIKSGARSYRLLLRARDGTVLNPT